jgi:hypothetical protein
VKRSFAETVAVLAVGLAIATSSYAQNAKPAAGGGGTAPAAGAGPAAGDEGQPNELKPAGKAAPGGQAVPGAKGNGTSASPGTKSNTTTGAEPGQRKAGEKAGNAPDESGQKPGASSAGEAKPTGAKPTAETGNKAAGQGHKAPQITSTQKTQITKSIREDVNVKPVTNLNIKIGVGVAVPRTIEVHRLPPAVIRLVPEYEGYDFFETEDAIVIVDPATFEIVYVLPL